MSSIWCIAPEDTTINLTWTDAEGKDHPFWVRIRRRLNVGEERQVMTAGWRGVVGGKKNDSTGEESETQIAIDWRAQSFARTRAYLLDWSLDDDRGQRLKMSRDVIETLHPDVYKLIEDAITAHVEAMQQEKKVTSGSSSSQETSS